MTLAGPEEIAARLAAAWQRVHGETPAITALNRVSAGASAQTWTFRIDDRAFVVQLAAGAGDSTAGSLSRSQQARVQEAAACQGVLTPGVVLVVGPQDGLPEGFVSRHVRGETLGKRITGHASFEPARAVLPGQCARVLAQIHSLDLGTFDFLQVRGAGLQLRELAVLHRGFGEPLPVFEAAFAWLAAHAPDEPSPRLVHGDFRNGNLLVDPELGLTGVLDWELAHLGDPMEDLAWLCMRSWRFGRDDRPVGGFGERAPFHAAYASAAGVAVDEGRLCWWGLLASLKWGVICQSFAHRRLSGELKTLEPAVIGRRVSEVEWQLLDLLEGKENA